jgi:hypothetical protein
MREHSFVHNNATITSFSSQKLGDIMEMEMFSIYTGLIYNEDVDSSWSCTNEPCDCD